jgi:SlyX protein
MSDSLEHRVGELESRLAHYERVAEDLSAVVAGQGRTIERLALQLRQMTQSLIGVQAMLDSSPQDDKPPPHY